MLAGVLSGGGDDDDDAERVSFTSD